MGNSPLTKDVSVLPDKPSLYKEDFLEYFDALYNEPEEVLEYLVQVEKHIFLYGDEDEFLDTLKAVKDPTTFLVLCSQGVTRSINFRNKIGKEYPEKSTPIKQLMLSRPSANLGVGQILDEMQKQQGKGNMNDSLDLIFMHDPEFNELIEFIRAVLNEKMNSGNPDPRLADISLEEIMRADFSKLGIRNIYIVNKPH